MINSLIGFSGKQLNAIAEVVLEHGTGIVSRKAMEEKCRARPNGNAVAYPPATIFKNEAMKLTIKMGEVVHHVPGMFNIPWATLGLFAGKEQKDLRDKLKSTDASILKDLTVKLKSKLAAVKPAVTVTAPVVPVASTPTAKPRKGKGTPVVSTSPAKARKSKGAAAGATDSTPTAAAPVADDAPVL